MQLLNVVWFWFIFHRRHRASWLRLIFFKRGLYLTSREIHKTCTKIWTTEVLRLAILSERARPLSHHRGGRRSWCWPVLFSPLSIWREWYHWKERRNWYKKISKYSKIQITPCHCANIVEVIYLPKNELVVVSTGYSIHMVVGKREREREREREKVCWHFAAQYIDNNNNIDLIISLNRHLILANTTTNMPFL